MALKKCKECGEDVSTKASTCPKCGAPIKKKTSLFTWIVTILVVFVAMGALLDEDTPDSASAAKRIAIGETFRSPKFEIQLERVASPSIVGATGLFPTKPAEGAVYVAVMWNYKNISDKPISGGQLPTLFLTDPDGTRYKQDFGASVAFADEAQIDTKVVSDLNPGIRVQDAAVFEVSKALLSNGVWQFFVDADENFEVPMKR